MKFALITGVRRLGFEIARHLIDRGYSLGVVYRTSERQVDELKSLAKERGTLLVPIKVDLSEEGYVERIKEEIEINLGRLDAFLHLASPYYRTSVEGLSRKNFYDHFVPIAEAFVFISALAYKLMLKNDGRIKGRIVAFGDWAIERTPYRNYVSYFVSKGALHSAVKVLAKEFAPYVLVNCIALGPTMKAQDMSDEEWERILRKTPLRRPVSIRDLLAVTDLLLETESVTGEIFMLDSGRHIAGSV